MSQSQWLRTDEQNEAVRALEMARSQLTLAGKDPLAWKWALVALHNAIQNFVAASTSGPARLGTLKSFIAEKWLETARTDPGSVDSIPDYFPDLYARMKRETGLHFPAAIDLSVLRLNEFRNSFIHFTPSSWLIHLDELPGLALECLKVLEALGWDPGCIVWREEAFKDSAHRELEECRTLLERLDLQYRT
ncbi:MAG TPA: hypothetical protein VGK93_00840 [Candidatus Eisenbacteria bacterium]|jgi:hypothetical protein